MLSGIAVVCVSNANDILRLRAFLTLRDGELNPLAFGQSSKAVAHDTGEVGKNVGSRLLFNESKAFAFVEPFYGARGSVSAVHDCSFLFHTRGYAHFGRGLTSQLIGEEVLHDGIAKAKRRHALGEQVRPVALG
jgi:hypothetical protein